MTRPATPHPRGRRSRRAVRGATLLLVVLAAGPTPLTLPSPAQARAGSGVAAADGPAESTVTPLAVSLDTLAPATVPRKGRLVVSGRITNRSQQTWTRLNAYLLTSTAPITSSTELTQAAATDADVAVGERVTGSGLYDEVGDLAPGQSIGYRLSVRRRDLRISGAPGVYWVGVHVLGAVDGKRDTTADGRARTFMPLLPEADSAAGLGTRTRLALVVPVQATVRRRADARLLDTAGWDRTLGRDGRLDRLLALSGRSRGALTWILDPALLDAVRSVAEGNPPLDTSATTGDGDGDADGDDGDGGSPSAGATPSAAGSDPSPGSGADPSADPSAAPGTDPGTDGGAGTSAVAAARARAWLGELRRQSRTHTVMTVPYGDLDVAAVLGGPVSTLYDRATALSSTTLGSFGITGDGPVVAPGSGYLPASALDEIDPATPVLLDDQALPDAATTVVPADRHAPVVLSDAAAGDGGPKPGSAYAALAVRQRLLSEAALHALSATRDQPLVVTMPQRWDPGGGWARARFFAGLDQPWLDLVDLPSVVSSAVSTTGAARAAPVYPVAEQRAEIPLGNQTAARQLVRSGGVLARLLTLNDTVDDQLSRVALLAASANARSAPTSARDRVVTTTGFVRSQMGDVRIVGPPFVMMSGESGPVQVTLVNDLDRTVTAGLRIRTPGSKLRISSFEPVTLGPGQRSSIRLGIRSEDIGVHRVSLQVTDAAGVPLGSEARFNVRTSRVSTVIWVIIAAGGALLLVAIAVRLLRRLRRRQASPGPLLPREPAPAPEPGR